MSGHALMAPTREAQDNLAPAAAASQVTPIEPVKQQRVLLW
jgi:hypothetical protein